MRPKGPRTGLTPLALKACGLMLDWLRELAPGEAIPTEVALAGEYEISRTTVRTILGHLEQRGLIRRHNTQRVLARKVQTDDEPPDTPDLVSRDQQVVRYVLDQLARGAIQPGQKISEKQIATALGFSTGPVREAMLALAPMGIIRKRARRQWEAAALDARQWEDLMELRTLVELHCLEKLFRDGSLEKHRRFLEVQLQRTRRLIGEQAIDVAHFLKLDLALHQWLLESCGNHVLIDRHRFIYATIEFQARNRGFTEERARLGALQHVSLLETLLKGDAARTRQALREHLEAALVTLKTMGDKTAPV
jgi:DNA-binding GntR family transcriptional regulator